MKLFIPEIGTELVLTKEWSFKLILENRNNALVSKFYPDYIQEYSYYNHYAKKLGHEKVLKSKAFDARFDSLPSFENIDYSNSRSVASNEARSIAIEKLWNDYPNEWIAEDNLEPIVFPVGTILKVDRIYIRKGKGMSDYSSITFYALLPGEKKKLRFFAHLNDINTIECELK